MGEGDKVEVASGDAVAEADIAVGVLVAGAAQAVNRKTRMKSGKRFMA